MVEELSLAAALVNQDDSVRAVTITGSGTTFSSGWEPFRLSSPGELSRYQGARVIASIQVPVVAAINGDAIGQGLELALAADLRIAVSSARFAMPQVSHGLLPWDGGTQRLARIVGRPCAMEMLLTGESLDAQTALRKGLVNRVVEPEELNEAVEDILERILAGAPIAVAYAKEAVREGMDLVLGQGLRLEADLNILLHSTRDRAEGLRSFSERRAPVFRGE